MPTTKQLPFATDATTQELWRVAESCDIEELGRVLSRGARINARNAHGMTALMRAAYCGHTPMVQALLERGADPNLARNDKFTALALAAFFGHTETVRILIEHGAQTNVVTRCGASAQTWATRRTFVEAARCLESNAPAPVTSLSPPLVVKPLTEPPEIWDLVHEVPRGFNPRSAFISRLSSINPSLVLRIAAVMVVSVGCVVGVLVLRGSQARSLPAEAPVQESVAAAEVSAQVNVEDAKSEPLVEPEPEVNQISHHSEPSGRKEKPARRVVVIRQTGSRVTTDVETKEVAENREAPAAVPVPVVSAPKIEPRQPAPKPNTGLSPRLIAPAKSAPAKPKVIQWP